MIAIGVVLQVGITPFVEIVGLKEGLDVEIVQDPNRGVHDAIGSGSS
jgi:hypothetical protein